MKMSRARVHEQSINSKINSKYFIFKSNGATFAIPVGKVFVSLPRRQVYLAIVTGRNIKIVYRGTRKKNTPIPEEILPPSKTVMISTKDEKFINSRFRMPRSHSFRKEL